MESNTQNSADEVQVKNVEKRAKLRQDIEVEDLREILKSVSGRRFIWRMLKPCFALSFVAGDQSTTAFNEGERSFSNRLMKDAIDASPQGYLLMQREMITNGEKDD